MWRLFDLVGVTEMFDEFVLLLGGAAAARPPPRARPRHVRDLSHRRLGRAAALGVPRAARGPRDGDRDGAAAASPLGDECPVCGQEIRSCAMCALVERYVVLCGAGLAFP